MESGLVFSFSLDRDMVGFHRLTQETLISLIYTNEFLKIRVIRAYSGSSAISCGLLFTSESTT